MKSLSFAVSALLATMLLTSAAAAEGNAEDGETVFKRCMTCHRIGPDAKNLIGPNLTGVIGRQAGSVPGFEYSQLMKNAGESGLVWTEDLIYKYIEDPGTFLKEYLTGKGKDAAGAAKMVYKLADEQDRLDVIAYLKTFSPPK